MKKFVLFLILLSGCNPFIKTWEEISIGYGYPSWTQDNKIVFLEEIGKYKYKKNVIEWWLERGGITVEPLWEEVWLWEVDTLQNYQRMVVFGGWKNQSEQEEEVGQGIWIMNIDGTNDHQIVNDEKACNPQWDNDGNKISYGISYYDPYPYLVTYTIIIDTNGHVLDTLRKNLDLKDWGPANSNLALCVDWKLRKCIVLNLNTLVEDTLNLNVSKWSPSGNYFMGYDGKGWFCINKNGYNKWYIKP